MRIILFLLVALVIAGGGAVAFHLYRQNQLQQAHAEQGEMEIIVSNLSGSGCEVYRAGNKMDEARKISVSTKHPFWLSRGNYFLLTTQENHRLYYPIPVLGYASGPDDGAFKITIRSYAEEPPGSDYVYIPSGNFLMGDRLNPSEPQYVWLGSFFIGAHEVTNSEFRKFLTDPDGYNRNQNWSKAGEQWKAGNSSRCSALLKPNDSDFDRFGKEEDPVVEVKWFEANAYARWLTRKFGSGKWIFSLPSEAEWEKAARGPDGFDYGLGATISDAESHLYNWKKNPDASVTVVDTSDQRFPQNRYGVFHMSGNVSEWTQSEFLPFNRNHPYDEFARNHDDSTDQRVVRGGSWYSASIALLYLPYRDAFQPQLSTPERGFRIVVRRLPG